MEQARADAPGPAYAVVSEGGDILAAAGADAAAFRPTEASQGHALSRARDGEALLLRLEASGGRALLARLPAPDLAAPASLAREGLTVSIVNADGLIIASAASRLRDQPASVLGLTTEVLAERAQEGGVHTQGELRLTAVDAQTAPATVVAAAPAAGGGLLALFGDAWILIGPLGLGLGLGALVLFQERRARRAARVWADTERRFRTAVEAARCGIWEWDLDRDEVVMSDVMAGMLGFGRRRRHRRRRDHRAHRSPAPRRACATPCDRPRPTAQVDVSFRVDAPDQPALWIELRGQAPRQRGQDGFAHIIGVALDVTEERRAQARAQAAENRLRDAIESVSEAFVLWDRHGRLMLCNQNFRTLFGFEPGHPEARRPARAAEPHRRAWPSARTSPRPRRPARRARGRAGRRPLGADLRAPHGRGRRWWSPPPTSPSSRPRRRRAGSRSERCSRPSIKLETQPGAALRAGPQVRGREDPRRGAPTRPRASSWPT